MHQGRTTLSKFLIQQLKGSSEQSDLAALLVDIAAAVKAISAMTAKGELGGVLGSLDSTNIQGETQKKLDVMSDHAFINTFSMGGLVADIHRILMRGGVFMYPRDTKDPSKAGRLRLMYEANPMSMVIEQAGGIGSTGRERILDLAPHDIHQRVPVVIGSRNEVERIEKYHQEYDSGTDEKYTSPLFQERSLYAN